MRKRYYAECITPLTFEDGTKTFVLWYRLGGLKRGSLHFRAGSVSALLEFATGMIGKEALAELAGTR